MEEIPVEVVRDHEEPEPPPARDWRPLVVPVCAVVVAVATVLVAWSQLRVAAAAEREQCLQEAQVLAFGPGARSLDQGELFRELAADCGVAIDEDEDEG